MKGVAVYQASSNVEKEVVGPEKVMILSWSYGSIVDGPWKGLILGWSNSRGVSHSSLE
jgi:hypothetical protein